MSSITWWKITTQRMLLIYFDNSIEWEPLIDHALPRLGSYLDFEVCDASRQKLTNIVIQFLDFSRLRKGYELSPT